MQRKIIHIDCDCFYAAIEMRDNPSLRHIPVAVGGSSDRRGVIATCNYLARDFGVHSAMATARAKQLCPQLTVVKARFSHYKAVSKQILAIMREYSEQIEPLSLDEAYLDVSQSTLHQGSATRIAMAIRQRVEQDVGITVSAGVAPNKFLAKIASDWKKPNGLFVILPDEVDAFVHQLPVTKLHGVGRVTAKRLHDLGIHTCADLRQHTQADLHRWFGRFGHRLHELSRGIDDRRVKPDRERKSLSVENTFPQDLTNMDECTVQLKHLVESLNNRSQATRTHYRIAKAFVKIKYSDFTTTTIERRAEIVNLDTFICLCQQAYHRKNLGIRLLGVGLRFHPRTNHNQWQQLDLFANEADQAGSGALP